MDKSPFKYLDYNPAYRLTEAYKKEILESMTKDNVEFKYPYVITTVIRVNGGIALVWDQAGAVKEKRDMCYGAIRFLTNSIKDLQVIKEAQEIPCDIDYPSGKKIEPESDFWKQVHAQHMEIYGPKIKDAPYKYDINVTVYLNGYLMANHWMVFGSSNETTKQEALGFVGSLLNRTSDARDKPTAEELDIIFSNKKG